MDISKLSIYKCKPYTANFTDDSELNPCIVETAGFVPLEVRFKQFEQNGLRAQFTEDQFTSNDLRQIYLSPDLQIYPGDDLIDIEEKLDAQRELMIKIQKEKAEALASASGDGESPSNKETKSNEPTEKE